GGVIAVLCCRINHDSLTGLDSFAVLVVVKNRAVNSGTYYGRVARAFGAEPNPRGLQRRLSFIFVSARFDGADYFSMAFDGNIDRLLQQFYLGPRLDLAHLGDDSGHVDDHILWTSLTQCLDETALATDVRAGPFRDHSVNLWQRLAFSSS